MLEQCTAGELSGRIVLACYPRAVRSLLQWKEADAKAYLDIRTGGAQEVLAAIMGTEAALTARTDAIAQPLTDAALLPPAADAVPEAWFPIIDKERCTECGKCHDFCLFGVYAKSADGRVCVVQPQSCKNNCPACARVCPSRAVIFPKYEKSPVNGGLTEEESFTPQEAERMYRERLRYKLQQRSGGVPLTKSSDTN
jgi:NAD-dependent dihydropyrimidine dehydrogenase PreA subunit